MQFSRYDCGQRHRHAYHNALLLYQQRSTKMAVKVAGHSTSSILTIQLITVVTSYTILPIACHFEHSPFLCWYKIFKKNYVLSHCALHQLWTHSKNLLYYHEKLQFMCYCYFSDFLNSINVTLTANCNCINVFVISRKTVHEILQFYTKHSGITLL